MKSFGYFHHPCFFIDGILRPFRLFDAVLDASDRGSTFGELVVPDRQRSVVLLNPGFQVCNGFPACVHGSEGCRSTRGHYRVVTEAILYRDDHSAVLLAPDIEGVQPVVDPMNRKTRKNLHLSFCAELLVDKTLVGDAVCEGVQAGLGAAFAVAEGGGYVLSTWGKRLDMHLVHKDGQRRASVEVSRMELGREEIFLPPASCPSNPSSRKERKGNK